MLRPFAHPVACCCAKFETGQTFSPVQTDVTLLAYNSQHCWELLRPFARSLTLSLKPIKLLDTSGADKATCTCKRTQNNATRLVSHSYYCKMEKEISILEAKNFPGNTPSSAL